MRGMIADIILVTTTLAVPLAAAQPWSFTKIVDTHTSVPGSNQTFNIGDAFQHVSVYSDRVAFRGRGQNGRQGVYEWRSGLGRVVADQNTTVPNTGAVFIGFADVNATSGGPTFYGGNNDNNGLFHEADGGLAPIVDSFDQVPDHDGTFVSVRPRHHTSGGSTAFAGSVEGHSGSYGVYRSDDGALSRAADLTMNPPDHPEPFKTFSDWRLDGDATYFCGFTAGTYGGIFRSEGDQLATVVDTNDVVPSGRRIVFAQYVRPDGEDTVFNAFTDDNIEGIYVKTSAGIDRLVDQLMTPPDGSSATFGGIEDFDYQNGTLIFQAGNGAIYTTYGGSISRVIGPGDVLDGKQLLGATFYEHGFDGATAAFWVTFQGDSSFDYDRAIYTVTIPGSGTIGLFALTAVTVPRRKRGMSAPRSYSPASNVAPSRTSQLTSAPTSKSEAC